MFLQGRFKMANKHLSISHWILLGGSDESAWNAGDPGSILGLGRVAAEGNSCPLQYSCLVNPHGQRSLAGYSPWDCKESGLGRVAAEGNSCPLQYSCLVNPHGQRSLAGYSPCNCKESGRTEPLILWHTYISSHYGNASETHNLTLGRTVITKKDGNVCWGCREVGTHIYCWWEPIRVLLLWRMVQKFLKKSDTKKKREKEM